MPVRDRFGESRATFAGALPPLGFFSPMLRVFPPARKFAGGGCVFSREGGHHGLVHGCAYIAAGGEHRRPALLWRSRAPPSLVKHCSGWAGGLLVGALAL